MLPIKLAINTCRPAREHLPEYRSATDAHGWASDLWTRAQRCFGINSVQHEGLTMSTAYSGIGAPEHAMQILGRAIGLTCQQTSAFEKKTICKAELRLMFASTGSSNTCIFSDIFDTVSSPGLRKACGLDGNKANQESAATLFERDLHRAKVSLCHLKCFCHNKKNTKKGGCSVRRAHIHISGSTCTDHSTFGACKGDEGEEVKVFLVWVAQRRISD